MPPNMPTARGRAGAKEVFNQFVAMKANLTLTPATVSVNGPMAVEQGTYSVTFTPPGAPGPVTDTGKYLVHWKQVGGKWLLANDIWNSDLPAMPMPAGK
jgi:ketosteroid isomerase-like protein